MSERLRARPLERPFQLALVEPEIPQNTGNIGRLSAATQCPLHLVGRLGFRIDEHAVRRAGLDYWHLVTLYTHPSFAHFERALAVGAGEGPAPRCFFFSAKASRSYLDADYRPGDALVFGRESVGLPAELTEQHPEHVFGIPTLGAVRSLNLANTVSIVLFEALRQAGALADPFLG